MAFLSRLHYCTYMYLIKLTLLLRQINNVDDVNDDERKTMTNLVMVMITYNALILIL